MTVQQLLGGGMNSLTALNRRLIAQQSGEEDATPAEQTVLPEEFGRPDDPEDEEDEKEEKDEVRGRFSVEDPLEFNRIKEWIEATIFAGETTGMTSLINAFVNEWDVEFRRRKGFSAIDNITLGPTLEQLVEDNDFINGAVWLPLTANNALPSLFESTVVDEDGFEIPAIAVASPLTGVEFIEITETLEELKQRPQALFEVARRGRDLIRRALSPTEPGEPDEVARRAAPETEEQALIRARTGVESPFTELGRLDLPDYMKTLILYSDPAAEGRESVQPLPVIPQSELIEQLVAITTPGGGGRRGTAGRRDIVFDKANLLRQVEDLYNSWMLSPDEAPASTVQSIVNSFIRDAQAFWSGQGGQLDFDTFVREKLQELPRYDQIYKFKLPTQTEEQFLGSFQQPIERFGQRAEFTRSQTEAAVTSGGSPTEQLRRVSRTREVQLSSNFSQRLAQTLAGIGVN